MGHPRTDVIVFRLQADEHQLTADLASDGETREKHSRLAKEFRELADAVERKFPSMMGDSPV